MWGALCLCCLRQRRMPGTYYTAWKLVSVAFQDIDKIFTRIATVKKQWEFRFLHQGELFLKVPATESQVWFSAMPKKKKKKNCTVTESQEAFWCLVRREERADCTSTETKPNLTENRDLLQLDFFWTKMEPVVVWNVQKGNFSKFRAFDSPIKAEQNCKQVLPRPNSPTATTLSLFSFASVIRSFMYCSSFPLFTNSLHRVGWHPTVQYSFSGKKTKTFELHDNFLQQQ